MILIADAGASKTDWRFLDGTKVLQFGSAGFNPRSHPLSHLIDTLPTEILARVEEVTNVYYYGAGLADQQTKSQVKELLRHVFMGAEIAVESDVLGAARSLFGREGGIVCILGTGASACVYDGKSIVKRVPSLGYLLGDEGSGTWLGREVLQRFLRGFLPAEVHQRFEEKYPGISEEAILQKIYQEREPNAYLSRFAEFIIEFQHDPYIYRLAYQGIETFFTSYFGNTKDLEGQKIRFAGSVAYYLSNIIRKFAADHHLMVDMIAQSPVAGLTLYHQEHG